ncbi:hypothetical protein OR1_02177 [Geobacter sp. OR-1]|uniref:nuclear transport factor 2 family protein n=1 Tax=Geobacter sp. OR-1 TaxID=1266765 RepID=UPI00054434DB|nr:nuclear transport factor 2 family protein [Geobacter sp. OR-1]GAM09895.1 hypothetical protein OR1_02177 [Geobacter sp. OR-1]
MKFFITVLAVFVLTLSSVSAFARSAYQTDSEASTAARAAFEEILDLWRADRYDDLYDRTQHGGKTAKEDFARKLGNATFKPACCWQKMQDVSVHVENDDIAVVRAKVGLEGDGDIQYKTRSYRMVREGDIWRISQSDLFSLAGAKAKKKVYKKHR